VITKEEVYKKLHEVNDNGTVGVFSIVKIIEEIYSSVKDFK